MIKVPDAASIAMMRYVEPILGRRVGPSTGTNLWGVLQLVEELRAENRNASIVTLLCDGGERYTSTYYNDDWVAAQGFDLEPELIALKNRLS